MEITMTAIEMTVIGWKKVPFFREIVAGQHPHLNFLMRVFCQKLFTGLFLAHYG
jgi:hypothetical protein